MINLRYVALGVGVAVHLVQDGGRGDEVVRESQVDMARIVQAFEVSGGEFDVQAPEVVVQLLAPNGCRLGQSEAAPPPDS
jgi:hypothetical protein